MVRNISQPRGGTLNSDAGVMIDRYRRQIAVKEIGLEGQIKLSDSRVAIIGCGANGSSIAELLARAGVGFLRLIDRDFVELTDLHRVRLYDEQDASSMKPKALVLAGKLRSINSSIDVEAFVDNIDGGNILSYVKDVDLVIDGSDNLELRFLINEASVETGVPWIMMGVESWFGMVKFIKPGETACIRCFMKEPSSRTVNVCEINGVINVAPSLTTSVGASLALKYIMGLNVEEDLFMINGLNLSLERVKIVRNSDCPICVKREYRFLGKERGRVNVYCGVDAVEINPTGGLSIDMADAEVKLRSYNAVRIADDILLLKYGDLKTMVFKNGKIVVYGTVDVDYARKVYSEIIGLLKAG